ncbi:hypothetical protein BUV99_12890, partial [Corynebacterium diphtheriae]
MIEGLTAIKADIEAGNFEWRIDLEDVYMNIESRLTQRIGITGKKLHTGRSRNDQVATEATDAFVAEFTASVQFDQRFYKQDIAGSIAHATMLAKVGVLTEQERDDIIEGLTAIKADIEAGNFEWRIDLEDV